MTYAVMWIGNLALAGIPPFAGYYSKDAIIAAAYAAGTGIGMYGFICTVLAAFLTAFYSWRLLIMTFHGRSRADHHVMEHVHESPPVMLGAAAGAGGRRADRRHSCCTPGSSARTGRSSGTAASSTRPNNHVLAASGACAGVGRAGADSSSACSASPPPM